MKILHWLILILLIIGLGLIAYGLFFNPSEVLEDQFSSIPEEELVLFYNRSYVLDPPLTWVDLKSLVVDFGFDFWLLIPVVDSMFWFRCDFRLLIPVVDFGFDWF